jgi:hypothetical protein
MIMEGLPNDFQAKLDKARLTTLKSNAELEREQRAAELAAKQETARAEEQARLETWELAGRIRRLLHENNAGYDGTIVGASGYSAYKRHSTTFSATWFARAVRSYRMDNLAERHSIGAWDMCTTGTKSHHSLYFGEDGAVYATDRGTPLTQREQDRGILVSTWVTKPGETFSYPDGYDAVQRGLANLVVRHELELE